MKPWTIHAVTARDILWAVAAIVIWIAIIAFALGFLAGMAFS